MAKQKKGSVGPAPKNSNDINSDLTGNGTYQGARSNVAGQHRLLMRDPAKYPNEQPKSYFIYVHADRLQEAIVKHRKSFVRDLGIVKSDVRPTATSKVISYSM